MSLISLIKSAFTTGDYYKSMNKALKAINGDYHMLHYPFYLNEDDTFSQAQKNLIEYCISKIPNLEGKDVLDIGCGNGVVAIHIAEKYPVNLIVGVDLNAHNIQIANKQKRKKNIVNLKFLKDDAQNLAQLESNSIDVIINIESAFHYPNKDMFLKEVYRILKPGGEFIIADILTTADGNFLLRNWKKKMKYNHWSYSKYVNAFSELNLKLRNNEDISEKVIMGFKVYRKYFDEFNTENRFGILFLKLFFIVNIKLNIHLLEKRRKYYVFHGKKH